MDDIEVNNQPEDPVAEDDNEDFDSADGESQAEIEERNSDFNYGGDYLDDNLLDFEIGKKDFLKLEK